MDRAVRDCGLPAGGGGPVALHRPGQVAGRRTQDCGQCGGCHPARERRVRTRFLSWQEGVSMAECSHSRGALVLHHARRRRLVAAGPGCLVPGTRHRHPGFPRRQPRRVAAGWRHHDGCPTVRLSCELRQSSGYRGGHCCGTRDLAALCPVVHHGTSAHGQRPACAGRCGEWVYLGESDMEVRRQHCLGLQARDALVRAPQQEHPCQLAHTSIWPADTLCGGRWQDPGDIARQCP